MNPKAMEAKYAVRGELVLRAMQYEEELEKARVNGTASSLPFDKIVYCNIGNPQSLQQKPITFFRQVLALCNYPELLSHSDIFPVDAITRAREYLAGTKGGTGAYSESQGIAVVRRQVAQFITERDGHPASEKDIFLSEGASQAISVVLNLLTRTDQDAIMIPVPQYPLYSATLTMIGASAAPYYLDESKNWGLTRASLVEGITKARAAGKNVRALVVINPGNPSGAILTRDNVEEVIRVCDEYGLVLLADEVYQTNAYNPSMPFVSFKKVARDIGSSVELFSFHSVSKGVIGECGRRGGYVECTNIDESVKAEIYKVFSIGLCSNIEGQITVGLMCHPPSASDPSYALYKKETTDIFDSLKRRAGLLSQALNEMDNVSCCSIDGAMYAFPSIRLPPKAVEAAKALGKAPDVHYALELLAHTGICVVPGSGFGQADGTYHVRTTFLPQEADMQVSVQKFKQFNNDFMRRYA